MIIGTFKSTETGFSGTINTLTFKAKIQLVRTEKPSEKAPDFRVVASGTDAGAAWSKQKEDGTSYYNVKLDDPCFAAPIFAGLVPSDKEGEFTLHWTR